MPQSKTDFHGHLKHYTHDSQFGSPEDITDNNNKQLKNKLKIRKIPGMEFYFIYLVFLQL